VLFVFLPKTVMAFNYLPSSLT